MPDRRRNVITESCLSKSRALEDPRGAYTPLPPDLQQLRPSTIVP